MTQCDCLNYCGDDSRLKAGTAEKCERFEQFNHRLTPYVEATYFYWLTQQTDNSLIEQVRQDNPDAIPIVFYKLLCGRIGREMYSMKPTRG